MFCNGAMTLSIMIINIKGLFVTFRITKFSIMRLSITRAQLGEDVT